MMPAWVVDVIFWALVAAIAVLAYGLRHRALFCLAALAFLPFIPAGLRYALADPTIVLPRGAETTRVFIIAAMSFLPVWIGLAAGLLFDWLNTGFPERPVAAEPTLPQAEEPSWRETLADTSSDDPTPEVSPAINPERP